MWKKGRGKLGLFRPLLGEWVSISASAMGPTRCTRRFEYVLDDKFVQLQAEWVIGDTEAAKHYSERALFGPGDDGALNFWSFTSDGKRSTGVLTAAPDIHADAICFEAEMPAGRARQVYWPHPVAGFNWAVESQTQKGWNRFVEHCYQAPVKP
tara:strand:+ start:8666 stop:9124 length:459 start_codon:yes stop_codon:yes gene_type:complete